MFFGILDSSCRPLKGFSEGSIGLYPYSLPENAHPASVFRSPASPDPAGDADVLDQVGKREPSTFGDDAWKYYQKSAITYYQQFFKKYLLVKSDAS